MKHAPNRFLSLLILFPVILIACTGNNNIGKQENKKKHKKNYTEMDGGIETAETIGKVDCDTTLWRYVYDPARLEVKDYCMEVEGVIVESDANEDGDQHMLLKLDKGQKDLLTKRNKSRKGGNLVIEVVCQNNITKKKAKGPCKGYTNNIQIPKLGQHVKVKGSYVIDSHNGWAEIHPVTSIEIIK